MKVLNLGSLNVDKIYRVKSFVQPKETIKASNYEESCGGKGLNQSVALAKAGATVYHAGKIGIDGEQLLHFLQTSNVRTEYVKSTQRTSGHAIIQVDDRGQNSIIIFTGANAEISLHEIDHVLNGFDEGDILLLQNEISNVGYAIQQARYKKMKIVLNPSPMNEMIESYDLDKVDYFIVNEVEAQLLSKTEDRNPERTLEVLQNRFPNAAIVLTLGEKGAYYADSKRRLFQSAFRVKPIDTTGAGDTFCGYLLAGIAEGRDIQVALMQASAAAALSVTKHGAAQSIPSMQEVDEFLKSFG